MEAFEGEAEQFIRILTLDLFGRVVLRTPVDKGPLRNNWQLTLGSPATGIVGAGGGGDATSSVSAYTLGQDIWLTNNLPYAPVWEFGLFEPPDPGPSSDPRPGRKGEVLVAGGYSLQAPQGMLAVSVQEIEAAFG